MAGGVVLNGATGHDVTNGIDVERAERLADLGILAAGIAHEIRNSLVSVQTFFQLAPIRLDDAEFRSSFLALAQSEVERACALAGELLDVARPAAADRTRTDLSAVVTTTTQLLLPHARQKQIDMSFRSADEPLYVHADVPRIKQVLINIVMNALDATPPGGEIRVRTRLARRNRREYCQVQIEDTGSGIPAGIRTRIFSPFVTGKSGGTGLGLAIAHRIVTDHEGFICADSASDRGTRFDVFLPFRA